MKALASLLESCPQGLGILPPKFVCQSDAWREAACGVGGDGDQVSDAWTEEDVCRNREGTAIGEGEGR